MTLLDFFENEYRLRRLIGKSPNTSRLYRQSISAFSQTIGHAATLDDLTNENVVRHMQARLDGKFRGKSRGTANKDRCQLLAIWRMAARLGMVAKWPEVALLSEPERIPKAWMQDELARLLRTLKGLPGYVGEIPEKLWWVGIVSVALDTGERIGAVQPAEWGWLDGNWLEVPAESRKGGKRDRKYWICDSTVELLGSIRKLKADKKKIFPWPHNPTYLWGKYKKILDLAGLPNGRNDAFHKLRRTHASVLHAAGFDAQEALDHQHRRTTRRYLDPRFERNVKPSEVLAEYLRTPGKREKSSGKRLAS